MTSRARNKQSLQKGLKLLPQADRNKEAPRRARNKQSLQKGLKPFQELHGHPVINEARNKQSLQKGLKRATPAPTSNSVIILARNKQSLQKGLKPRATVCHDIRKADTR